MSAVTTERDNVSNFATGTLVTSETDEPPLAKCFDSFVMYFKFAIAFINSCMISMTLFLNRKSKDYRYVIQALEKEKKHLKVVMMIFGRIVVSAGIVILISL